MASCKIQESKRKARRLPHPVTLTTSALSEGFLVTEKPFSYQAVLWSFFSM